MTTNVLKTDTIKSTDGLLRVGMTFDEAYAKDEKTIELFKFADKNNDNVLDEKEIVRYNGPILAIERDDKTTQRFVGQANFGLFGGQLGGDIISIKEKEFYPGQTVGEIVDKDFILMFKNLDLDSNGVLSKKEMEKYEEYVTKKQKYDEIVAEEQDKRDNNALKLGLGAALTAIAASWTGTSTYNLLISKSKKRAILATIGAVAATVGTGILATHKILKKECIPEERFKNEIDALKTLDNQYKDVYNK